MIQVIRADDIRFLDQEAANFRARRQDAGILSAGTGMFFKRELEFVFRETLMARLAPPNLFRLFPIDTSVSEGATSYTQRMLEPVGEAAIISDYADDLPRVNVVRREERRSIIDIGDSYSYSVREIMAARFANVPLDRQLGVAAREAIEKKHNRLGWFGDVDAQLFGILRHPDIPRFLFANPIDATTPADTIIDEINSMINRVNSLTKTVANVNTLVLPPDEFAFIFSTPRSATTDTTIADFLLDKNPFLEFIEQAWELDASENGGQKLAVAYRRDPMNVKYVAPVTFRQLPVERRNLEFIINNMASSGGFYTPRPLEMVIGELA